MRIRWTESNRVTELEFLSLYDFTQWAMEQAFNAGETIEFLTEA